MKKGYYIAKTLRIKKLFKRLEIKYTVSNGIKVGKVLNRLY